MPAKIRHLPDVPHRTSHLHLANATLLAAPGTGTGTGTGKGDVMTVENTAALLDCLSVHDARRPMR